jgi:hypothetical protein
MEIHLTEDDILNLVLAMARASGLYPQGEQIEVLLSVTEEDRSLLAIVRTEDTDRDAEEPNR